VSSARHPDPTAPASDSTAPAADSTARPSAADEVLETSGLVLELIHAGHAAAGSVHLAPGSEQGHGLDGPRVSRPAIRASIELYQRGQLTMGDLASALGMSAGWATRVVDELVSAGFAERITDPHDRRVVHVRLAAAARDIAEGAYRWRSEAIGRALAGLDPAERRAVRLFLARAIEELSRP
jgi:DNA-binding MarR family transcriptional regulator